MRISNIFAFGLAWLMVVGGLTARTVNAQQVVKWSTFIKRFDKNGDGKLAKDEVPSSLSRLFSRGDKDGDGLLTAKELAALPPLRRRRSGANTPTKFTIPPVSALTRVDKQHPLTRAAARMSAWVLRLTPHAVKGNRHVILTDHQDKDSLAALARLAQYRKGEILQVADLGALQVKETKEKLQAKLKALQVRYLAVAPRPESYREKMLLGLWELATTLDEDPLLDLLPGLLVASTAQEMVTLVDRTLAHRPQKMAALRPFAISQVMSDQETRSLQKAGILRNLFADYGRVMPAVAIYSPAAAKAPILPGKQLWNIRIKGKRDFLKVFPDAAAKALAQSSLVVMHGHGVPGMSCSVDIEAISRDFSHKVLLCGSCFSGAAGATDFPKRSRGPAGFAIDKRQAFALRAVANGADVVFAHMRLNSGFPHLFPVLEWWLAGRTLGEGYQGLINALITLRGMKMGDYVLAGGKAARRLNQFLYVVLGDPALQPFEKIEKPRPPAPEKKPKKGI